jgi:excisionase family DNA binding protein
MTIKEAAKDLGLSRPRVSILIKEGRIQATKLPCGCWDITSKDLGRYKSIKAKLASLDVKVGELRSQILNKV